MKTYKVIILAIAVGSFSMATSAGENKGTSPSGKKMQVTEFQCSFKKGNTTEYGYGATLSDATSDAYNKCPKQPIPGVDCKLLKCKQIKP